MRFDCPRASFAEFGGPPVSYLSVRSYVYKTYGAGKNCGVGNGEGQFREGDALQLSRLRDCRMLLPPKEMK